MNNKSLHPKIFQNSAFVFGALAIFVFALGFSFFAYNVLNSQVLADTDSSNGLAQCLDELQKYDKKLQDLSKDEKKGDEAKAEIEKIGKEIDSLVSGQSADTSDAVSGAGDLTKKLTTKCKDLLKKAEEAYARLTSEDKGTEKKTESAGDKASASEDFRFMGKQQFSAVKIEGMPESAQCKEKSLGQVVLVTDLDAQDTESDKRIEAAISTSSIFTKRGTLQAISSTYIDKIIEGYKKSNPTGPELVKEKLVSGLYFPNVPLNSDLKIQLYSPGWSLESVSLNVKGISSACDTIFVTVFGDQSKEGDFDICVHSSDKTGNYSPKKTFAYPKDKEDIDKYKKENTSSTITSLGPCQDVTELAKKANAEKSLDDTVGSSGTSPGSPGSIGYDPDPGGNSGSITSAQQEQYRQEALQAVNDFRRSKGLKEFTADSSLQKDTEGQMQKMITAGNCGHVAPINTENIAGGGGSPSMKQLIQFWIDEEKETDPEKRGHYETLINPSLTRVGSTVGIVNDKEIGTALCLVQNYGT